MDNTTAVCLHLQSEYNHYYVQGDRRVCLCRDSLLEAFGVKAPWERPYDNHTVRLTVSTAEFYGSQKFFVGCRNTKWDGTPAGMIVFQESGDINYVYAGTAQYLDRLLGFVMQAGRVLHAGIELGK